MPGQSRSLNQSILQIMKAKFLVAVVFALIASFSQNSFAANSTEPSDIKVVVSEKKIWFVADEIPVKCLCVKIKNKAGQVVLEKSLTSKTADWSINVEALPKGEYSIEVGKDKSVTFKK